MTKQRSIASLLGIVIFLWGATLFAQGPDTLWTKTYGGPAYDEGYSVCETSDSGYIVAGYTSSFGAGKEDVWLLKTDPNGDTLWTKTYGGPERDQARSVQQTSDGGYIVAGYTYSFGAGEADFWLLKTDADGDTLWTRTYGDTGWDLGSSVQQTPDEGYIIVGSTASVGPGEIQHVYVIKTDADGDTLWTRIYSGGAGYTRGISVKRTSDGCYIIAGTTLISSEVVSSREVYLIKTDANGDSLWTRTYGDPSIGDWGASVCETSDGSYIITGGLSYLGYKRDVFLLKTDANGDSLWAKIYGGRYSEDHGSSVCETSDGGYMIAGCQQTDVLSHYNIYLVKTDADGDTLWTRDYGYSETWNQGYSVCKTSDGGYIVAGGADYLDPPNRDVCLLKMEPDVGIEEKEPSQETFVLSEPEPNPFADKTLLNYQLPKASDVRITVYDPLGRKVRTLLDSPQSPGVHTITWDGTDGQGQKLSSGLYFIRIASPEFSRTAKVVMIR
jgi:hypothetical protein